MYSEQFKSSLILDYWDFLEIGLVFCISENFSKELISGNLNIGFLEEHNKCHP